MVTCPVCKEQMTGFVCAICGFDRSTDYAQYPTLVSGISSKSTAGLKSAYAAAHTHLVSQLDRAQTGDVSLLLRCQKCGNVSFGFLPASNTLICTE